MGGASDIDMFLNENRGAIYGTLASILGALLGFVVTTLAILLTFADSPRLSVLRQSRHYETLWKVFVSNIRTLGLATTAVLAALLVDRDSSPQHVLQVAVVWTLSLAILRVARAAWILEQFVMLVTKRRESD